MGQCKTCLFGKRASNKKTSTSIFATYRYACKKPEPNPLWNNILSGDFGCDNYEAKQ